MINGLYKDVFLGDISQLYTPALLSLLALLVTWLTTRYYVARPVLLGLYVASIVGVLYLTLAVDPGRQDIGVCFISASPLENFGTREGLGNLVLFSPVGVFGVLATRRPTAVALWVLPLTVAIETAQATIPEVARICESGDVIMNTSGTWLGVLGGILLCAILGHRLMWRPFGSHTAWISAVVISAGLAVVWATSITVVPVASTEPRPADREQARAFADRLAESFGDAYRLVPADAVFHPDREGGGRIFVEGDGYSGYLEWPDAERFNVAFPSGGYQVPGTDPDDPDPAEITRRYLELHAGWLAHSRAEGPEISITEDEGDRS